MHATLVSLFSGVEGHWFVDSTNYVICKYEDAYRDLVDLEATAWNIIPGETVQMDIIFHSMAECGWLVFLVCPVCGSHANGRQYHIW